MTEKYLPRLVPSTSVTIQPEPFTPSGFSPFGTAILSPLPQHLASVPSIVPEEALWPAYQPRPARANQNTALKTAPVSALTNNYVSRSEQGTGLMSVFSCFPRRNTYVDSGGRLRLKVEVLERHPFTTQTFCPFNLSSPASTSTDSSGDDDDNETYFLVVVAPTLQNTTATPKNPPDLTKIRAFVCSVGGSSVGAAVTYAPGTWHAPMVVLGKRRVDFLVTQFVNGVPDDDCQEVLIGEEEKDDSGSKSGLGGGGRSKKVEVDLVGLGLDGDKIEEQSLWKPRRQMRTRTRMRMKERTKAKL